MNPCVSIITVCFNCVKDIKKTIESVSHCLTQQIEYIVIDGGSTDGTLDIIKEYEESISFWISEPDKGIYDAMNKGLEHAKGKWAIFINVGDLLRDVPDILLDEGTLAYDAVLCPVETENGIVKPSYNWNLNYRNTIPHQGLFYNISKSKLFFDICYKVYADYDLNLQIYKRGCQVCILDKVVAFHSLDGISNIGHNTNEFYVIIKKHNSLLYVLLAFLRLKYLGIKTRFRLF